MRAALLFWGKNSMLALDALKQLPPAATVIAVTATVYGIIQAAKRAPTLAPYLNGWVAIAVNVVLNAAGLILAVPADQLYTTNTLFVLVSTVLGSAGIHGTVKNLSTPQVLAT